MAPIALAQPGWPFSSLSFRAFQCWLTVYRRIWRSSVWSMVLGPVCYLGALGFGLGTLVDKHSTASLGGVPYLAFLAPAQAADELGRLGTYRILKSPGPRRHGRRLPG